MGKRSYGDYFRKPKECFYCGSPADTADHVVPVSRGGADRYDNVLPACRECNTAKGTRELLEFLGSGR
jgi:5-methylcytosine-specific restriction endonuclease McrA